MKVYENVPFLRHVNVNSHLILKKRLKNAQTHQKFDLPLQDPGRSLTNILKPFPFNIIKNSI